MRQTVAQMILDKELAHDSVLKRLKKDIERYHPGDEVSVLAPPSVSMDMSD